MGRKFRIAFLVLCTTNKTETCQIFLSIQTICFSYQWIKWTFLQKYHQGGVLPNVHIQFVAQKLPTGPMPMKFWISVLVLLAAAARFWQEMDRLRNEIGPRPHTNEISKFLVGPSSRWGLTQCLYPVWGPKNALRLYGKEISTCLSSSVYY